MQCVARFFERLFTEIEKKKQTSTVYSEQMQPCKNIQHNTLQHTVTELRENRRFSVEFRL